MKNTDNTQTKHNPENNAKQYYPHTTLSHKTRWAYSTMLPSTHRTFW